MEPVISFIFHVAILLMSVVIHEFAHGWMALQLGDPTAKNLGRLTLNPIKHLDPIGSFVVPLMIYISSGGSMTFGWAKPVPYNPYHLRDPRYGEAKVAVAGPAANLLVALVFGLILRFTASSGLISYELVQMFNTIVVLNIVLAVFNLLPLPPLDGSKILFAFLPNALGELRVFLERYGMILTILFIVFAFQWIYPLIFFIYRLIVGSS